MVDINVIADARDANIVCDVNSHRRVAFDFMRDRVEAAIRGRQFDVDVSMFIWRDEICVRVVHGLLHGEYKAEILYGDQ